MTKLRLYKNRVDCTKFLTRKPQLSQSTLKQLASELTKSQNDIYHNTGDVYLTMLEKSAMFAAAIVNLFSKFIDY